MQPEAPSFPADQSKKALLDFLARQGVDLDSAPLPVLIEAMLRFYEQVRPVGLDPTRDADMLLFEWGVYDWGQGETFNFGVTRQFIEAEERDDDAISQLHLTIHLPPTAEAKQLPAGNYWCDGVAFTPHLHRFILESDAFRLASSLDRLRVDLWWSRV